MEEYTFFRGVWKESKMEEQTLKKRKLKLLAIVLILTGVGQYLQTLLIQQSFRVKSVENNKRWSPLKYVTVMIFYAAAYAATNMTRLKECPQDFCAGIRIVQLVLKP